MWEAVGTGEGERGEQGGVHAAQRSKRTRAIHTTVHAHHSRHLLYTVTQHPTTWLLTCSSARPPAHLTST
jgi:hypothetical protein